VLILSQFAGAAAECAAALIVNPYDPEVVSMSIAQALAMPLKERRERNEALFQVIAKNDIYAWSEHFLAALTDTQALAGLVEPGVARLAAAR
jgi:trehalose 6-phosphate synthase